MRPERLVLEGVYSYRNLTEIDFDTLCRAELFGIFGKVGSGKSAVLEAVTYVLYGRIERLSSKMMNYNMMNLVITSYSIHYTKLYEYFKKFPCLTLHLQPPPIIIETL